MSWNEPLFTGARLVLDQVEIGQIATRAESESGRAWRLPDGATLQLQLAEARPSGVEVRLDGDLLEGRCERAARSRRFAVIFASLAALGHLVMAGGLLMLARSDPRQLPTWQDPLFLACSGLGATYTILAVGSARANVPALLALALLGTIEVAFCLLPFLARGDLGTGDNPWLVRAGVAAAGVALALIPIRAWYWTRADRPRATGS